MNTTSKCSVNISSFYPYALNLKDKKVLVLGSGDQAYREILRLTDAGAHVTIICPRASAQIAELLVIHASRTSHVAQDVGGFLAFLDKGALKQVKRLEDFFMAFLFAEGESENALLARRLESCRVPCHIVYKPDRSQFVTGTSLKRGHLKISVTTDGLCHPLERAISRRIEETFGYDFDQYSLFLASIEEKLAALRESSESDWLKVNQRLEEEDFCMALSRRNFEEALRMVDMFIAISEGQQEEEEGEIEINRPRKGSKGANQ